jgi:protein AFG1
MLDVLARQHVTVKKYAMMGMGKKDAMPEVARSLAAEGRVLCFDEFQVGLAWAELGSLQQVTDIVSAMILRQLLERLMSFGVVCVMTSK